MLLPQWDQQDTEQIALGLWPSNSDRNHSGYLLSQQTEPGWAELRNTTIYQPLPVSLKSVFIYTVLLSVAGEFEPPKPWRCTETRRQLPTGANRSSEKVGLRVVHTRVGVLWYTRVSTRERGTGTCFWPGLLPDGSILPAPVPVDAEQLTKRQHKQSFQKHWKLALVLPIQPIPTTRAGSALDTSHLEQPPLKTQVSLSP